MKKIILFYARKKPMGGSTSFTVHLYRAMLLAGIDVSLIRISEKEKPNRILGQYKGVMAHYVTPKIALKLAKKYPSLLTSPEKAKFLPEADIIQRLMKAGMRLVVHDPSEFEVYDHLEDMDLVHDPFCIRPTMKEVFKDAIFIPHPYIREYNGWHGRNLMKRKTACSIARIAPSKRTDIILEANTKLQKEDKILLFGDENRLYTYNTLMKKYPNFKQGGHNLPLKWGISARKVSHYKFAVDMSYFPEDGGGSQYTFMEAWDAGTVNIIHKDWLRYEGEMEDAVNCIAVKGPIALSALIKNAKENDMLLEISKNGTEQLKEFHDPVTIAKKYYKELTR